MDDAIRRAAPSPRRPVGTQESWACVAIDTDFTWIDPMWSGPDWRGHVAMFEMPPARLKRRERLEVEAAIERWKQTLPSLSRQQRRHGAGGDGRNEASQGLRRRVTVLLRRRARGGGQAVCPRPVRVLRLSSFAPLRRSRQPCGPRP